jgi:hypothetical protein
MAQASAAVSAVTAGLAKDYPATNEFKSGIVLPYHAVGNTEASDVPIMMAVWPAARFSRPVIMTVLKDDAGGGVRTGRAHRLTSALQVAIAVPLLVLTARSLDQVRATGGRC